MSAERGQAGLPEGPQCPLAVGGHEVIVMAHGGGGRLARQLLEAVFFPAFEADGTRVHHDGAVFAAPPGPLAFTTDSYVVRPLFFPGGDIGKLAVWGTVNDLAMCGALPLALSAGFILEEGFSMATLRRVVQSMAAAARQAGVSIVTGDTKVVERGCGDGVYINTAGVGRVVAGADISPRRLQPGDAIVANGDLARHGIAVLTQRPGFEFENAIDSDCADVSGQVRALLAAGIEVHCLRDLTRGGLAANLVEIAAGAGLRLRLEESALPLADEVAAVCELLGLDPLYVACEGRFVAFVPAAQVPPALAALRGAGAPCPVMIGEVSAACPGGQVILRSRIGGERLLDMPSGEQLPRIC